MTQQQWPFENLICGMTSGRDLNEADDQDSNECDDAQDAAVDTTVYVVEGGQIGYGSEQAWDAARELQRPSN